MNHSSLSFRKNAQRGFSLLELLVVISIMGILMALAVASYSTAQQRGRDAKRKADLKSWANAMEQYYVSGSVYSATCNPGITNLPAGIPTDPKNVAPYQYDYACSESAYCLCARLEGTSGANATGRNGTGCSYSSSNPTHFCISNQQ